MYKKARISRCIGFFASLIFTLAAYMLIVNPEVLHLETRMVIYGICALALLQAIVQCFFFLDILSEDGPPWNLSVFISTLSIIFIIVFFSIWIMGHLDDNMMPKMD